MWGFTWIERFLQDLRIAARSLRRNALFSAVAIATFALGIGANTAIFSVVNAVLLRPLPYPEPQAIVQMSLASKSGDLNDALTVPEFEVYRDHSAAAFQAIAGFRGGSTVAMKRGDVPEWITSLSVTDGLFAVLGVRPILGRAIQRGDTRPGSPRVAVLSNSLWRSAFGGDPSLIGRQIELNDVSYTVVGVMPSGFTFVEQPAAIFVSLQLGRSIADTGMNTRVIARLRSGTTIARAQANMNVVFETLRQQGLAQSGQRGVQLKNYQKWLVGDFQTSVLMLFGAVSLLLLIACANVASLLMARASSREREIAIRLAIGSGRLHLLQQFLAESMLIAFAGDVAGILASTWALKGLMSSIPWNIPLTSHIGLDHRVLIFTLLITAGTSLVFGFTSFWQASRLDLNTSLKESNASGWRNVVRNRARGLLVVGEIAVSVTMLIVAGLLIESLYRLHQQRLGFIPDHVSTLTTPFAATEKLNAMEIWEFEQGVLRRVQATPGIASAAVVSDLPLTGPDNLPTQHQGHPEHSIGGMEYRAVSSQYFKTMQIPLIGGRAFRDADTVSSTPVAIVSASVARAWWHGKSPIGDQIVVGEYKGRQFPEILEQPRQVVGVVADVKNLAIDEAVPTTVYVPASQLPRAANSTSWVVRPEGNFAAGAVLLKAIKAAKPNQRILDFQPMADIVAHSIARPSFDASLMSTFAALALALTSVGIYGLLSFQVARRIREIGIRMALGAKRASVLMMIVRQGALLALFGIGLGVIGALVLTRFVSNLIAGVRTTNLLVYALVCLLLLIVALFASFLPARRASKVDPLIALRYE